ncbi:MAG: hypothetical protein FWD17_01605 [Polyangiaceae bacterium]|nr:hypothetical protein [Polyangiaceae bacterium]
MNTESTLDGGTHGRATDAPPVLQRLEWAVALVLLFLPLLMRLAQGLAPMGDADVWWHLAAGRWIVDHGAIPSVDPFHSLGESREWLDYSWSADAAWWLGYRRLGMAAPLIFAALLYGLMLVLCAALVRIDRPSSPRRAFVAGAAYLALAPGFLPRTFLVTIVFSGIVLLFIRAVREGASVFRGVGLLPLFALWANVHVEFVYGWFFLGLAVLDMLARDRRRAFELAGLTAFCVASTAVNPFGPRLLFRIFTWSREYGQNDIIQEMLSLSFRRPEEYLLPVLLCAAVVALVQTNDRSVYRWGSLVFAAAMSFHSRRASWMIVLVALDVISALPWLAAAPAHRGRIGILPALALGATVVLGLYAGTALSRRESLVATDDFPFGAVRYAREHALAGPMYNHYDWGGFLRFELPDIPGNIDGRGTIFSTHEVEQSVATWRGEPGWADDPLLRKAGFVIAGIHSALAQLLRLDTRFHVAYEDPVAVVFVPAR